MKNATFGAGCFWGVEAAFRKLKGVLEVTAGYAGGSVANPTYEDVCTGRTGHTEVVQIEYDPGRVSYDDLLGLFWDIHDPTTLNRQGPDIGTQYRSAIFVSDADEEALARRSKEQAQASGRFAKPIVTEITSGAEFFAAEDYHQNYFEKIGRTG
jgi:peptide-methionine (S)-S-oxide reductase